MTLYAHTDATERGKHEHRCWRSSTLHAAWRGNGSERGRVPTLAVLWCGSRIGNSTNGRIRRDLSAAPIHRCDVLRPERHRPLVGSWARTGPV